MILYPYFSNSTPKTMPVITQPQICSTSYVPYSLSARKGGTWASRGTPSSRYTEPMYTPSSSMLAWLLLSLHNILVITHKRLFHQVSQFLTSSTQHPLGKPPAQIHPCEHSCKIPNDHSCIRMEQTVLFCRGFIPFFTGWLLSDAWV
jgi:hypothetical protein